MSVSQPLSYTVHDFLTRVVPGAISSISIFLVIGGDFSILTTTSPFVLLSAIGVFYLFGEGIEYARLRIMPVPKYFGRALYTSTANEAYLTSTDFLYFTILSRWRECRSIESESPVAQFEYESVFQDNGQDFWSHFTKQFELDESYSDSSRIFKLFLGHIQPHLSLPSKRLQRTYIFFQNVKVSAVLGIILAFLFAVASFSENPSNAIRSLALIFILALVLFYAVGPFGNIDEEYVDSLLVEYFEEVMGS